MESGLYFDLGDLIDSLGSLELHAEYVGISGESDGFRFLIGGLLQGSLESLPLGFSLPLLARNLRIGDI